MLGAAFDLVCSLRPLPLCGGVSGLPLYETVFIARIGRLPNIQYSGKLRLRFVRILTHITQSPIHKITSTTL